MIDVSAVIIPGYSDDGETRLACAVDEFVVEGADVPAVEITLTVGSAEPARTVLTLPEAEALVRSLQMLIAMQKPAP